MQEELGYIEGGSQTLISALVKAIEAVKNLKASEMRFPSGKSFGELVTEAVLAQVIVEEQNESPGRCEAGR